MKKTMKWIASMVAFVLCFAVLFTNISEILRRKTAGAVDMINSFYRLDKNSVDVLMIGSSHLYYGVQTNILWGEYGFTSYAMGSPSQTVPTSYFLLKEALNYQKPKVVLMESYYFFGNKYYVEEARARQALDAVRFGKVKWEAVNTFFPELSFKEKLSYYMPFLKYHGRWSNLNASDFQAKPYLKGSILDYGVEKREDPGLDMKAKEIPQLSLEYFEKIVSLCEENDIELILFATPYGYNPEKGSFDGYAKKQAVNLTLEKYLEEKGIPFLFYQKTGEAGIDFAADFRDSTHLNAHGQAKITRCLGDYLTANCELTDHRGDDAYSMWEEDYALYRADVEKKTASGGAEG